MRPFHSHPDHHRRDGGGHYHGRRFARAEGPEERGRHGGRHGHGHDHPGRGGGRGGLKRFFAHGDLRVLVLSLIAEKPRHGYEIIKAIEDRVHGAYSPSPGVIYPTLTLLEELGYVALGAGGEGGKKLYEITGEGRSFLDANRKILDRLLARMDEASRGREREAAPQIVRAMENLRAALRLRLGRGPLDEAQIAAIAAELDAAAAAVERV